MKLWFMCLLLNIVHTRQEIRCRRRSDCARYRDTPVCSRDLTCKTDKCETNTECAYGERCSRTKRICKVGCISSRNCRRGQSCNHGICSRSIRCQTTKDCKGGMVCFENICRRPKSSRHCVTAERCKQGFTCYRNSCTKRCTRNSNCPRTYKCSNLRRLCLKVARSSTKTASLRNRRRGGRRSHKVSVPKNNGQVLVLTGQDGNKDVMVLSLESGADSSKNALCPQTLSAFPIRISGAIGVSFKDHPFVCGGAYSKPSRDCYMLNLKNEWRKTATMNTERFQAAAVVRKSTGSLMISGGKNTESILATTEVTANVKATWTQGPEMPKAIFRHCIVEVDTHTVMVVGGSVYNTGTKHTEDANQAWLYDFNTADWKQTGKLTHSRHFHACDCVKNKRGEVFIAVVGGFSSTTGSYVLTTELLKLGGILQNENWTKGPVMPHAIIRASAMEYKGDLFVIGGHDELERALGILRFNADSGWSVFLEELPRPVIGAVSMLLTQSFCRAFSNNTSAKDEMALNFQLKFKF